MIQFQALSQAFNYGLFLPPCDGRAGKFLLEDRTFRDYPFHDCVAYLEVSPQMISPPFLEGRLFLKREEEEEATLGNS